MSKDIQIKRFGGKLAMLDEILGFLEIIDHEIIEMYHKRTF
jgi:hypothetical protein